MVQQRSDATGFGYFSLEQRALSLWSGRAKARGRRRWAVPLALLILAVAFGGSGWAADNQLGSQQPPASSSSTKVTVSWEPPKASSSSAPSFIPPSDPMKRLQSLVAQAHALNAEVLSDPKKPNLPNIRRRLDLLEQIRATARPLLHAGKPASRLEARRWVAQAHEDFARALDGLDGLEVRGEELFQAWESQRKLYRDVVRMRAVAHYRSCVSLGLVFQDKSVRQITQQCGVSLQKMSDLPGAPYVPGGLHNLPKGPGKLAATRIGELSVCVTENALHRPDDALPPKVVAILQVSPRGEVTQVAVDTPEGGEGMGACLAESLKLWAFPFIGEATTLEIPIELGISGI